MPPDQPIPDLSEHADGPPLIALLGEDDAHSAFPLGDREYDWHDHVRGQVFCVESGLVHVRTPHGSWLMPPHRAGWIPPGVSHRVSIKGALSGWTLLLAPRLGHLMPDKPCVFGVNELMRALVRRAVSWADPAQLDESQTRLLAVLLDEMCGAPQQPLHLPMPSDRRAQRIAAALFDEPGSPRTLEEWAAWAGLSPRALSRLFRAETAMSFAQWRRQAQLIHALERLAAGNSVATVADALGYATPSNFIAMFRACMGDSPGRYFSLNTSTR